MPETGAEGEGDLAGLAGNTAMSVGGFGLSANARAEMDKAREQSGNTALSVGGREAGAAFESVRPAEVGRQRRAGAYYPDIGRWLANTAFSIGERRKAEYRGVIAKKRPDLPSADVDAFMGELDKLGNTKAEKAALHWFVKGGLQLPEDGEKFASALKVAPKFKLDPFGFGSPDELLAEADRRKPKKQKLAYIDPDTVPELTNKRDLGHGVVVYDVEDSPRGQAAMRRIMNSHLGREANGSWKSPWCLLTATDAGEVSTSARKYWRQYNKSGRGAAFQDGRLIAFQSSDRDEGPEWWDLQDDSHDGNIPTLHTRDVEAKTLGLLGAHREPIVGSVKRLLDLTPDGTLIDGFGDYFRGDPENGVYERWSEAGGYTREEKVNGDLIAPGVNRPPFGPRGGYTYISTYKPEANTYVEILFDKGLKPDSVLYRIEDGDYYAELLMPLKEGKSGNYRILQSYEDDGFRRFTTHFQDWYDEDKGIYTSELPRLAGKVEHLTKEDAFNEFLSAVNEVRTKHGLKPMTLKEATFGMLDSAPSNTALSAAMRATGSIDERFPNGAAVFRTLNAIERTALPTVLPEPVRRALADWTRERNGAARKQLVTAVLGAIPERERFYMDTGSGRRLPLSNNAVDSVLFGHASSDSAVAGKAAFLLAIPAFSTRAVQVYSEGYGNGRHTTYVAPVSYGNRQVYGTATVSGAGADLSLHEINYFDPMEKVRPARTTTLQQKSADRRSYSDGPNTKRILQLIHDNQALSRDELNERIHELGGNTALSVGERPGRVPMVEPGGDVREAGEGALAWLRRKFVHAQTPVFDAVRRVMGVGREPPDALNVEAAAKNVHGKIRARQEMLQRAYLEPLKAILAQPGMDRKRFDDYALALHALERNRMIQERSVVVDPTTGEVVDLGLEAGSGVTNAWAERVIREIQRDPFAEQYKEAAQILAEMNRFVLRGAVVDGLLTEAQAKTWMRLSPHYVPLILGRLRAGYRRQDAPGEAWKFGGLEVWLWRPVLVVLLVLFVLPRV